MMEEDESNTVDSVARLLICMKDAPVFLRTALNLLVIFHRHCGHTANEFDARMQ